MYERNAYHAGAATPPQRVSRPRNPDWHWNHISVEQFRAAQLGDLASDTAPLAGIPDCDRSGSDNWPAVNGWCSARCAARAGGAGYHDLVGRCLDWGRYAALEPDAQSAAERREARHNRHWSRCGHA